MLTGLIVVSVLAAAFAAGFVWTLLARSKDLASLAVVQEKAAAAGAESDRLRADLDSAERSAEQATQHLADRENETAETINDHTTEIAKLQERLASHDDLKLERAKDEERLKAAFSALSADQLKASRTEFLAQAKPVFDNARKEQSDLVKPISETLETMGKKLKEFETKKTESFASLGQWITGLEKANHQLRKETGELVHALRRPKVRGSYGEVQLKRVAELAGLREGIDFEVEKSVTAEDGSRLRPDMVINLPSGRTLVIDAKTNIEPYLDAFESTDPVEQETHLARFAEAVSNQATLLSRKAYLDQFDRTPDFIIMFVPGDQFVDAALQQKPELLTKAWETNIILASPTTLIGLLRAVELGWRENALAENTEEVRRLGTEMLKRSGILLKKVSTLGGRISQSVAAYDEVAGSLERNFMPQLRKFGEAGIKPDKELTEPKSLGLTTRRLEAGPSHQPTDESEVDSTEG